MKFTIKEAMILFVLFTGCSNKEEMQNNINRSGNKEEEKFYLAVEAERKERKLNNILIFDGENQSFHLTEVLNNGKTFIYYFTSDCCMACVDDNLAVLKELSTSMNPDQILMITGFDNIREMNLKRKQFGLEFPVYNTEDLLNISSAGQLPTSKSLFAIIDKNLNISNTRYAVPEDSIDNPYFKNIFQMFNYSKG